MNTKSFSLFILSILIGISTISAQCPSSVNNYYNFNEGGGLSASGSQGGTIALINPTWTSGVLDGAVSFNGTDSKGNLSDNYFNWTATQEFTIEFWLNLASVNASVNMVFIGRDDPSTTLHWWIGAKNGTAQPIFDMRDNNNVFSEIMGSSSLSVNTWYHLAVVRNNALHQNLLYVNGQLEGTSQVTYTGTFTSNVPVNLGFLNYNSSDSYFSNCKIDELVFHNTALSASAILQHYQDQLNGTPICQTIIDTTAYIVPPVKILTLGNSITYDSYSNDPRPAGQKGGYRVHLYNKLTTAGYNFNFVGSEIAGQDLFPDPENGGFPGINKTQMVTLLQTGYNLRTSTQVTNGTYLDVFQPDVILLHIGTNDLTTDITAINQILDIIDSYRTQSGKIVRLIIAKIINRMAYDPMTTQYNANLEAAVIAHNNSYNYIVDMENGAGIDYAVDMIDNLHPTDAGYQKMATLWYSALTAILDPPVNCTSSLKGYWNFNETSPAVLHDQISGHHATGNANVISAAGKIKQAISFNGVSSQASINNGTLFNWTATSSFSMQFWMRKNSQCNGNTNNVIIGRNDNTNQLHWWIGVECSSGNQGKITFNLVANNGDNQELRSSSGVIDNNWHLITVTRNGSTGNAAIYIDNILETSGTQTFTGDFSSDVPVNIGWLNLSPFYYYDGLIDELAVYDKALDLNEINSMYVAGFNNLNYCQHSFIKTPSNLVATPADGEIDLTWKDNSTNENGFKIERKTGTGQFAEIAQVAAGVKVYNDPGLLAVNTYTYRVYAFNEFGNSTYSNLSSAKALNPSSITNLAPGKPVVQSSTAYGGVAARGNDNNTDGEFSHSSVIHTLNEQSPYWQIDLQESYNISYIEVWNRTDACCIIRMVNYYVFVSDAPFTSGNLTTTINQSGVWNVFNANYPNPSISIPVNRTGRYMRIQLANTGELNMAEFKVFGTGVTPTIPNPPTNLLTHALTSSSVKLDWTDNSTNESVFRIERKTGSGSFAQVAELPANTITYNDPGLQPLTTYTYRVYAFNTAGPSLFSNESTVQTPDVSATPTNLSPGKPVMQSSTAYGGVATRGNDNNTDGEFSHNSVTHTGNEQSPYWQIDLQAIYSITNIELWNRTDACCINRMVNYYVFVSDAPFASGNLTTTINQSGVWNVFNANYPNPSISIPVNRTGRYVRVQFANAGELTMAEVRVFGITGTPTIPNAPTNLLTQALTSSSVKLDWTDNSTNEGVFRIERKTGSESFAQVAELPTNTITYTDPGLQPLTTYTYRVYAFNTAGPSLFSNESTVQTPDVSATPTNLSPGKPVMQSSTAYGGVATRGNDNNTDGEFSHNSVTHTGNEQSPYWQIDLQAIYSITNIELWNRTDACCINRMVNYYVFVSDAPFASGNLTTTINQSGVWNVFNANYPNPSISIPVNRTGRYVRVQFANAGELTMAEVRVFGITGTPTIPNAPTNLLTQALTSSSVKLDWTDNSTNEGVFRIERKTGSESFAQVAELPTNTITYTDPGLQPLTTYTYRVYAFNTAGPSLFSNESTVQTPDVSATPTNLSPGKPVMQSSTAYGGVAERGNDNNTDGDFSHNSVTHTGNEQSPYWQIDLQAIYSITNIELWNRTNTCCINRMVNYYVFVSDAPFASGDLTTTINQSGVWNVFNANYPNPSISIPVNRTGRYVRVQFANAGELTMAEVRVFGITGTPTIPNAPTNLLTQALTSSSVKLDWTDNSTNEGVFRIERKTGSESFAQVAELPTNTITYTDPGLQPLTTYTYRVYAFNTAGPSLFSNESTVQTPDVSATPTNLSPGKPVMQSSTAYGGVAERGNDNNTDGDFSHNSVTHTGNEQSPYWQIDLQAIYSITDIELWNRTNTCCINRMVNYYVFVSDVPFTSGDLTTTINQSGVWNVFNANYPNPSISIPVNRTGRYVRVQFANAGELTMAEVRVFGTTLKGTLGAQANPLENEDLMFLVYPNPAVNDVNIEFYLNNESRGSISIYDMMGRELKKLTGDHFYSGKNLISWDCTDAAGGRINPGIYIIKLMINEKIFLKKVIITKLQ